MVASPVSTTPRLSSRSASSSSETSLPSGALKLTKRSAIFAIESAEAVWRPGASQEHPVSRLGPPVAQTVNLVQEARFLLARHQHARAQQRPLNRVRRERLRVHVAGHAPELIEH